MRSLATRTLVASAAAILVSATAFSTANAAPADPPPELDVPVASDGSTIEPVQTDADATGGGVSGTTGDSSTAAGLPEGTASGDSLAPMDYGPESVIGDDQRTQVDPTTQNPVNAIVHITFDDQNGDQFGCTGWLYADNMVATAGHCVHPGDGNDGGGPNNFFDPDTYEVSAGRNGADTPYGTCGVNTLYSVEGWMLDGVEERDYGAIALDCNVGDTTGTWGLWWQEDDMDGYDTTVTGYPCDQADGTMWRHAGMSVEETEDEQLFYLNDTFGCQSGAPVYERRETGQEFCVGWCVMAIHAYGPHGWFGDHSNYNHGTRIDEPLFDNLMAWEAAN